MRLLQTPIYRDRAYAGRALAAKLVHYADRPNLLVMALPRGGVPVAFAIATALHAPLDVFLVRKLGVPGHEELAMGAVATGGICILDSALIRTLAIPESEIDSVKRRELAEIERQEQLFRGLRPEPDVGNSELILVDDGLATGASMRAAIFALKQRKPRKIVVAVPVAAAPVCDELRREVGEVVCGATPRDFRAVGQWYENFAQVTDEEVRATLEQARRQCHGPSAGRDSYAN